MRIALIDYGAGNLTSVRKALRALQATPWSPTSPADLERAEGIVVPGVGHFEATRALGEAWRTAVCARIDAGVPLLGICLGLQWLFAGSDEALDLPGLGLLPGCCTTLREPSDPEAHDASGATLKVPHVGWNTLEIWRTSWLLDGVDDGSYAYFTHSYAAPITDACVSATSHGRRFASGVERGRVGAVQFHPEKSGATGLAILRNFLTLAGASRSVATRR